MLKFDAELVFRNGGFNRDSIEILAGSTGLEWETNKLTHNTLILDLGGHRFIFSAYAPNMYTLDTSV